MAAYYNENDPKTAAWLRELITAGLIADGEVDTRSIVDVSPADLAGYTQCHFFAGIGGWSYALRLAGWPDDRAVWTGSCPCQPFSSAGAQAGGHDPRDLWPAWHVLIRECQPPVIFGEQVESALAHGWYDRVCDDLEREGYACGAASLPAASVGAFHIRQRLWFVVDAMCPDGERRAGSIPRSEAASGGTRDLDGRGAHGPQHGGEAGSMADTEYTERRPLSLDRQDERNRHDAGRAQAHGQPGACGEVRELDLASHERHERHQADGRQAQRRVEHASELGFWSHAELLECHDGKTRPIEPGTFPLAHGVPARVGRLRGYGNAIVPQVAAEVIAAYMECVA